MNNEKDRVLLNLEVGSFLPVCIYSLFLLYRSMSKQNQPPNFFRKEIK